MLRKVNVKQARRKSRRKTDFLNLRERRLLKVLSDGMLKATTAMEKAGYAPSTARKQQARVMRRPRVRKAILLVWYKRGYFLTDRELELIGKSGAE